jgi:hypothetical protein
LKFVYGDSLDHKHAHILCVYIYFRKTTTTNIATERNVEVMYDEINVPVYGNFSEVTHARTHTHTNKITSKKEQTNGSV